MSQNAEKKSDNEAKSTQSKTMNENENKEEWKEVKKQEENKYGRETTKANSCR